MLPSYQCKTRAFTIIHDFLKTHHLHLAKAYYVKVNSVYEATNIKHWARRTVIRNGAGRPNWMSYILARINITKLPMMSWNLKLVNIQKAAEDTRLGPPSHPTTPHVM